jgi:putative redox protein
MVEMSAAYLGKLRCRLAHGPSGSVIETDAPKDNMGEGSRFSPTDLVGAALASCVLTTMAIVAQRDGVSLDGARAEVVKEMTTTPPRRIAALPVKVTLPASIKEDYRAKLENAAHACPVHKSLHPDVKSEISFSYAG